MKIELESKKVQFFNFDFLCDFFDFQEDKKLKNEKKEEIEKYIKENEKLKKEINENSDKLQKQRKKLKN